MSSFALSTKDFFNTSLIRPSVLLPHLLQAAILPIDSAVSRAAFFALDLLGLSIFAAKSPAYLFNGFANFLGQITTCGFQSETSCLRYVGPIIASTLILGGAMQVAALAYGYFSSWALKGLIVGAYQALRIHGVCYQYAHITSKCFGISELESNISSRRQKENLNEQAERVMLVVTCLAQLGCIAAGMTPIAATGVGAPIMLLTYSIAYRTLLRREIESLDREKKPAEGF